MHVFWLKRAFRALCVLVFCVVLSASCAPTSSPEAAFSYAEREFSTAVSGTITRLSGDGYTGDPALVGESLTGVSRFFSATVTAFRAGDGGSVISVAYTAPAALAGVTVTRTTDPARDQITVTLTRVVTGGKPLTLDLSGMSPVVTEAWMAPADVLLPVGDITIVTPVEDGFFTVTRKDATGETVFAFAEGRGLPLRVSRASDGRQITMTLA